MSDITSLPETTVTARRVQPASASPMTIPAQSAVPVCTIEVYPFEGGVHYISGGQIRSVTVRKNLRGGSTGTFSIELAPGGPDGPESPVTWSQIITPMSHVLIGMSRGPDSAIVMQGVATGIGEAQEWSTTNRGSSAARGQGISGEDFTFFFNSFNFYALSFFGLTAGDPNYQGAANLPAGMDKYISQGLFGSASASESSPVQIGRTWYQSIMAGTQGILAHTYVPYAINGRLTFNSLVQATWEDYRNVYIPMVSFFLANEESWTDKFQLIFPFPWYEFFVTTAPKSAYMPDGDSKVTVDSGTQLSMASMPLAAPAGPQLVARVNPTPVFQTSIGEGGGSVSLGDLDMSRWNALPLYDLTQAPYGFLNSSVSFGASEARNFYQLNPTGYSVIWGNGAGNNVPPPYAYIAAADAASIDRYGFRPQIGTTQWLFDPNGTSAQNVNINVQDTIRILLGDIVSWYHPAPLMARGEVTIPLTPSILIGTRFRYAPFKDQVPWDFYVESVQHSFVFGRSASTKLTLSRGLPSEVYADSGTGGRLAAIFSGNAMRQDGDYVFGLPSGSANPLTIIVTPQQAAALEQNLVAAYNTPQY